MTDRIIALLLNGVYSRIKYAKWHHERVRWSDWVRYYIARVMGA